MSFFSHAKERDEGFIGYDVYMVITLLIAIWLLVPRILKAWNIKRSEEREEKRVRALDEELQKELKKIESEANDADLSPEAFDKFVGKLPALIRDAETLLAVAEREFIKGNPELFWDMMSKLPGTIGKIRPFVGEIEKWPYAYRANEQIKGARDDVDQFLARSDALRERAQKVDKFTREFDSRLHQRLQESIKEGRSRSQDKLEREYNARKRPYG